jgi:hypothetical protein
MISIEQLIEAGGVVRASCKLPIVGFELDDHTHPRYVEKRRADELVDPDGELIQPISSRVEGIASSRYSWFLSPNRRSYPALESRTRTPRTAAHSGSKWV